MAKKMKMDIVAESFAAIKNTIAANMENVGYEELVPSELIDLADKNNYGKNDKEADYEELAHQIEAVGLLNALGVVKEEDGRYRLFSGERRYKAITRYLKWDKIPCRVFEGVSVNKAQLMLHMANGGREYSAGQKLELYEEYNRLLQDMRAAGELSGGLQKNLAALLNVTDRQVRTYKQISENLTQPEKEAVISGETTIAQAQATAAERIVSKNNLSLPDRTESYNPDDLQPSKGIDTPIENFDWEPIVADVIKHAYDLKELYRSYVLEVMTPKEAVKEVLKPKYGYSGGTVNFSDGYQGYHVRLPSKIEIEYRQHTKYFSYSEIDAAIRQLIRDGRLLTKKQASMLFQAYLKEVCE